jgi:hypothetical protein
MLVNLCQVLEKSGAADSSFGTQPLSTFLRNYTLFTEHFHHFFVILSVLEKKYVFEDDCKLSSKFLT